MYSIAFLWLAGQTHKHLWKIHQGLGIFLFVSTVGQVFAFVVLWIMEEASGKHMAHIGDTDGAEDNTQKAYIVEHTAYMTHLLFYATFILFHSPDPLKVPNIHGEFEGESMSDPKGVAMKPLLHPVISVLGPFDASTRSEHAGY
jgi:hypothetical protein